MKVICNNCGRRIKCKNDVCPFICPYCKKPIIIGSRQSRR